jgi:hypothetical protein
MDCLLAFSLASPLKNYYIFASAIRRRNKNSIRLRNIWDYQQIQKAHERRGYYKIHLRYARPLKWLGWRLCGLWDLS